MSIRSVALAFIDSLDIAHSRHDENDIAQHGRISRMEAQWLELQGEVRNSHKRLEAKLDELLSLLKTNGSGAHG